MPKAEAGSTKYLNNKLKSKGLQRLRWYCQVCEKQTRDENGFKMHTQSESHVRQMLLVGEDPKKYINDYSNRFQRDFLQLLRTSHGEKQVQMNHFYQEYISNKEHIHMNATKWPSLTEFAKFLGREGICRVEETDKGIQIAWIDNSPEALRRQDAIRKKERQDRGDEEREQILIKEQVRKAKQDAEARGVTDVDEEEERQLKRGEGERIKLSFGKKDGTLYMEQQARSGDNRPLATSLSGSTAVADEDGGFANSSTNPQGGNQAKGSIADSIVNGEPSVGDDFPVVGKSSVKMSFQSKPKNVFAAVKKNALAGKKMSFIEQPKKMSEAERIMKEEMERKRGRESSNSTAQKRQRF